MKKAIFSIVFFLLFIAYSTGQACGIYKIRIIGSINSTAITFESIKIPKMRLLENKTASEMTDEDFIEYKIIHNKINIETGSGLGEVIQDPERLKKRYKEKNSTLTLILVGNKTEIKIKIDWDKIEIRKIEDSGFSNYFEMNLKEINL